MIWIKDCTMPCVRHAHRKNLQHVDLQQSDDQEGGLITRQSKIRK